MRIRKRLLLPALAIGITMVGLSSMAVSAQSDNDKVWCGLFNPTCEAAETPPIASAPTEPSPVPIAPPPVPAPSGIYAAVGDSVAAGLGLPVAPTASAADKVCGRSPEGYPILVANQQKLELIHAACSGATAGDMVTSQGVDGPNMPPQLDTAFAKGVPKLMTITAGANDAHWAEFIKACYTLDCTKQGYETTAKVYLVALKAKLAYALASIQTRSGTTPPQVIITGYYSPLSSACAAKQQNITAAELAWLDKSREALNDTIKQTASPYPFVKFVPVSFAGHDICASTPWVQGPNDTAPFHPTAEGQQAIAKAINAAIK